MRRSGYALLVGASLLAFPAYASPQDELEQTQQAIAQAKTKQAELAKEKKSLESELKKLQRQLVELAAKTQKSEADVSDAEDKLRIVSEQIQAKNDALKARRKDLAGLVQAVLHLSRVPPESMVMMPGDVNQTMKAAEALKMAAKGIKQEMESIGQQMQELDELKGKMEKNREALKAQQASLAEDRKRLDAVLAERRKISQTLDQRQKQEIAHLAKLAKKAQGIQELMATVAQEEKRRAEAKAEAEAEVSSEGGISGTKGKMRSFAAARGHIRPPVSGSVTQDFGEQRSANETSKGIVIKTRSGAQVTAPYDGEVVFSGPFLRYGRLIIISHSDGFHTLLAGLSKIDVTTGQFLLEGEPIGAMGDSGSQNTLYVELRKNNQPVDPEAWMKIK